jgi:outer membrane lipoprotein-sorting protein
MKKFLSLTLIAVFILALSVSFGFGQQTAAEVLEKVIEAQGGREVLQGIKDTTVTGTMEMTAMGMSGGLTMYQKEPNMMRMDFEVMGIVVTQAFDGQIAWWVNPQTGATEELTAAQTQDLKRQAFGNDAMLHPEKYGITFELAPKEKIGEKEYIVLIQTYSDGHKATLYIDPDTFLAYKTKTKTLDQSGMEVEAESLLGDYKKVDGTTSPHSITVFQSGQEFMKMTITKTVYNSNLDDSLFKMTK